MEVGSSNSIGRLKVRGWGIVRRIRKKQSAKDIEAEKGLTVRKVIS